MHKGQHVIGEPPPTMPDPPPPLPRGQSHTIEIGGQGCIVRPGDTLIIGTSRSLTKAEAEHILNHLVHQLPGVKAVIIPETSTLAIYRPEPTP